MFYNITNRPIIFFVRKIGDSMLRDLLNAIKFQAQPDKSLTKMQVKMNSEIDKDLASLVHHMSDEDGCIDYEGFDG